MACLTVCSFSSIFIQDLGTKRWGDVVTALDNNTKIYFWIFVLPLLICHLTTQCVCLKQGNRWKVSCGFCLESKMKGSFFPLLFLYFNLKSLPKHCCFRTQIIIWLLQPEFDIFILGSDLTEMDLQVRLVLCARYKINTGMLLWPGNKDLEMKCFLTRKYSMNQHLSYWEKSCVLLIWWPETSTLGVSSGVGQSCDDLLLKSN